jgi:membrane protease YdiL (CAAX protease family)
LALYAAIVLLSSPMRRTAGWKEAGRLGPDIWRWILATVAVSSLALIIWVNVAKPDLSIHLANIPDIPLWTYPLAAVIFATGNAAVEEVAFRGIVMSGLDHALGKTRAALALQAICFAAAHYLAGFPNGFAGFAMVAVYGAMLGVIWRRSGGLLAPWIAHVAADLTIFAILAAVIMRS